MEEIAYVCAGISYYPGRSLLKPYCTAMLHCAVPLPKRKWQNLAKTRRSVSLARERAQFVMHVTRSRSLRATAVAPLLLAVVAIVRPAVAILLLYSPLHEK